MTSAMNSFCPFYSFAVTLSILRWQTQGAQGVTACCEVGDGRLRYTRPNKLDMRPAEPSTDPLTRGAGIMFRARIHSATLEDINKATV